VRRRVKKLDYVRLVVGAVLLALGVENVINGGRVAGPTLILVGVALVGSAIYEYIVGRVPAAMADVRTKSATTEGWLYAAIGAIVIVQMAIVFALNSSFRWWSIVGALGGVCFLIASAKSVRRDHRAADQQRRDRSE
jgi:hypothetical protein